MADHDDMLIVGAGISGLSMAHYAATTGLKVRVLEQQDRPGGCLHSHRFSGALDGFWLELGAHSCFNSYSQLIAMLEAVGAVDAVRRRAKVPFRMFADEAVCSIPSQLYIPELLLAPFRLLGLGKVGRTVGGYYGTIVGQRNYAAVFEPAFNAVLCQPAHDYPADSLFQTRPRRKDFPRGFTLEGGLQTIAERLVKQAGVHVEFNQPLRALRREGDHFILETDTATYRARTVCLATPVAVAAQLLQSHSPAIAALLAEIETATIETVGVALRAESIRWEPLAGLIGRDQAFYSAVVRDTVPDHRFRGFTFHFRPGVLDDAGKLSRIAHVLNIPRETLQREQVVSTINRLPALRVGHGERTQRLNTLLAGTGIALTGNYFSGVAIEDCVSRARSEFERLQREG